MEKKLVSIIIPIYNVEKYLERCIESALSQDYEKIEIILVNDGSTDNSSVVCEKYKDNYKVKYINQKNAGVSVARNRGIDEANGFWIMFVDGDDYMEKCMVSRMVEIATEENCDILITPPIFEYDTCSVKGKIFEKDYVFDENKEKLELNIICRQFGLNEKNDIGAGGPWGKLYRADALKNSNCRFVVGLKRMQDVIFNLNIVGKVDKVVYKNEHFYHYRINSNSVCVKWNPNIFDVFMDVIKHFNAFINSKKDLFTNDKYVQCLNFKIILMFIEGIRIAIMHKDNQVSVFKKIKQIKEICSNEVIYTAFKNVDLKVLPNSLKVFVIVNRMKCFVLTYYMIQIFMNTKLKEQK